MSHNPEKPLRFIYLAPHKVPYLTPYLARHQKDNSRGAFLESLFTKTGFLFSVIISLIDSLNSMEKTMKIREFVTAEDVKAICKELKIRDWSGLTDAKVTFEEATKIMHALDQDNADIDPEIFRQGLEVELEHGTRFSDANVTNNHPLLTGKIVMAHLKESMDYYRRLEVAELEGDMVKAIIEGNQTKLESLIKRLEKAKFNLTQSIIKQLK